LRRVRNIAGDKIPGTRDWRPPPTLVCMGVDAQLNPSAQMGYLPYVPVNGGNPPSQNELAANPRVNIVTRPQSINTMQRLDDMDDSFRCVNRTQFESVPTTSSI